MISNDMGYMRVNSFALGHPGSPGIWTHNNFILTFSYSMDMNEIFKKVTLFFLLQFF